MTKDKIVISKPPGIFAGEAFARADQFLNAAIQLTGGTKKPDLLFPTYFLLTHSLELFLKSFLAARGVPVKEIEGLNHKLINILNKCKTHEIPHIEKMDALADELFCINENQYLRYPTEFRIVSVPYADECIQIISLFRDAIAITVDIARFDAELQLASDYRHERGKTIEWKGRRDSDHS